VTLTDEDLVVLSMNLNGKAPWLGGEVPAVHLMLAAQKLGEPVGATLRRLQRFAPLGLALPPIDPNCLDMTVSQEDLIMLSRDLDGRAPWCTGSISLEHAWRVADELGEPWEQTLSRLHRLATLAGIESPEIGYRPDSWESMRLEQRYRAVGTWPTQLGLGSSHSPSWGPTRRR